jgi:hypothetical protein
MDVHELQNKLQALQRQLFDLRVSVGTERIVTKYLSVVSLIPRFSGASNTCNVYEFIDAVNGAGKIGAWSDEYTTYAPKMELTGVTNTLYTGNTELHEENLPFERFTEIFNQRFQEIMPDQSHC